MQEIDEFDILDSILNDPKLLEIDEFDDSISDVIDDMLKDKVENFNADNI